MGISTRTPRRTPLRSLQDDTLDAAQTARAHGMLTESQLDRITDGKVSKADISRAEKILEKAEELLGAVSDDGDASRAHMRIAEERVEVAESLLEAITDQYDAQAGGGSSSSSTTSTRSTRSHK